MMHRIRSIRLADILTSLRIVLTPVVIWLIASDKTLAAYYLFGFAAITDYLDGYFARRSGKTATYGPEFDGLADFFLIYGTIITLFIMSGLEILPYSLALIPIVIGVPIVFLLSIRKRRLTIPHENMNLPAAIGYPAIMTYIIGWPYAWVLLVILFVVGSPIAINHAINIYIKGIKNQKLI